MNLILEELIGYKAELLTKALKKALAREFKSSGYDVTAYQWILLYKLWEEDGISQKELSLRTFMDTPTITRMIDVMEKKGLVKREKNNEDRRKVKISLTNKGIELEHNLVPIVEKHHEHALQNIKESEFKNIKRLMNQIIENVS